MPDERPELESLDAEPQEITATEAEQAAGGALLSPTRSLDLQVTPIKSYESPISPYAEGNSQPPNRPLLD